MTDVATKSTEGYSYDPKSKPPPFGHALRKYWAFDDGYNNLNHGSYGSLPLPVLAECQKLSLLAEQNPDRFHRVTYMPLLVECRRQIAELVGAQHDEIVFVPNATHGLNVVLCNIEWREGDVILGASTTYGSISKALQYIGDRSEQPRPATYNVLYTFPMTHAQVVDAFRARVREIKQAHSDTQFTISPSDTASGADVKGNRFVAVIDSIASMPGVLFPWKELVQVCKEENVWTVIDAAHSIGQEVNINLGEAQPDFWVSNCHKWLYVKRGCAALYVPKRNQITIKSSIPTSHVYVNPGQRGDDSFVKQHEWTGTMDFVPWLSVKTALEFRQWLGGEEVINKYCHDLAVEGGKRLAEVMGTKIMDEAGELTVNMTNVLVPLPVESSPNSIYTPEVFNKITSLFVDRFFNTYNCYPALLFHGGGWWARISTQVWNEISDFEYAGKMLNEICKEIKATILEPKAN